MATTVATTVAVSAAAAVWCSQPQLDRFEVMQLVYDPGTLENLSPQIDNTSYYPASKSFPTR